VYARYRSTSRSHHTPHHTRKITLVTSFVTVRRCCQIDRTVWDCLMQLKRQKSVRSKRTSICS